MAHAAATTPLGNALYSLEVAAYDLATGRARLDLGSVVNLVASLPINGGAPMLAVLRATAPRVEQSAVARRQFFHAARALVSLHRAHGMLEQSPWKTGRLSASAA
jgi:hypothetical protein